METC